MNRFLTHPAFRGALTASVMIITGILLKETGKAAESWSQYLMFAIYAIGIGWSIWIAKKDPKNPGRFGSLFQQGFRHFIVTALIMVGFTIYLLWRHPEFAREEAQYQRTLLIETKKYTPDQIDELVKEAEKQYPTRYISASVFGYLIMGVVFAAAGSVVLARKD
ncbi:MAG: DUF4199 domain-containing protein [Bacteroidota bacterium]